MKNYNLVLIIPLLLCAGAPSIAQKLDIPHHEETVDLRFGAGDGRPVEGIKTTAADESLGMPERLFRFPAAEYTQTSHFVGASQKAPWMRLYFDDVNLGENSFAVISSLFDGDRQYFTAQSIKDWQNSSGYFNGGEVRIDLYVAPGDRDIRIRVHKIVVGEFYGNDPAVMSRTLCGGDDRIQSVFPHIDARVFFGGGCTAWLTAGGFLLTAGHCADGMGSTDIIEFNVPSSLCDGTPQSAAIVDQYPVDAGTITFENAGVGDDWGIFNCRRNSTTLRTPAEAQRSYYHLSRSIAAPGAIMIRGFGVDQTPVGCNGGRNADNETLQFDIGNTVGETVSSATTANWDYQTDTEPANSGSAILAASTPGVDFTAVGIHTHGGCESDGSDANSGTSFEADDLELACNIFWQTEVEYADVDHHLSSITGSSVLPHESVQNAVNQANAGHGPGLELILMAGSNHDAGGVYQEAFHYAGTTHGVILRRTVGAVRIGPNAVAPKLKTEGRVNGESILPPKDRNGDKWDRKNAVEMTVFPNPFNDRTRIRFTIPAAAPVKLRIYDLNGTLIETLLEGQEYPAGSHEALFNVHNCGCPPGIYLAQLEAGEVLRTVRLGVVR